jgi:hypothetical protein
MAMVARLQGSCRGALRTLDGMAHLVRSAESGIGGAAGVPVPLRRAAARTAERCRSAAALTAVHRRTKARPPEVLRRARRQVQRRPHPDPEPA